MLAVAPLAAGDESELQQLIESDPGYAERVTGYPPGPADALSLLLMRPDGLPEDAKLVLGGWDGPTLVGVVDLLRGYPVASTGYVGLLMIHRARQGTGLGGQLHDAAIQVVRERWPEITTLRLAVVDTNAGAAGFWCRLGYEPTGETIPYVYDKVHSTSRLYEAVLQP